MRIQCVLHVREEVGKIFNGKGANLTHILYGLLTLLFVSSVLYEKLPSQKKYMMLESLIWVHCTWVCPYSCKLVDLTDHIDLGFYIHSCPKMRYKGDYAPSYLADPEDYTWFPVEECRPLLDKFRYVSFAHPEHNIQEPATREGSCL